MEPQLQSLINKIKEEGIEEASRQSREIINNAENRASKILKDAKDEAGEITEKARESAARTDERGRKALEQAGRDLVLSLRRDITDLFNNLLQKETGKALNTETLAPVLEKMLARWEWDNAENQGIEILLNEEDRNKLQDLLLAKLQHKIRKGVTLKPVKNIESGFRIGEKEGSFHYDFTDQGIAEMLAQYLNPFLAEILKRNKGKD